MMEADWMVPKDPEQRRCERGLFWAVIALAEFHMFSCSFREVLPGYGEPFFRAERWLGAAILVALVLYLVYALVRHSDTPGRLKALFRRLRSFEQVYMLWMALWYIVVVAVWQLQKGGSVNLFRENDWWMFEMALMAFVFFPLPRVLGTQRAKPLIETMLKLVLIPHMLVWAWILVQYFQMNYVTFPSGGMLGMEPDHSLTLGYNQNITGAGALIMMALCLYLVATQTRLKKLPYVFGALVYFTILVLSNCRTSWYCALLIAVLGCFFAVWYGLKEKHWLLRAALGLVLAAGCVLILSWLRGELFVLLIDVSLARFPAFAEAEAERAQTAVRNISGYYPGLLSSRAPSPGDASPVLLAADTGTAADYARIYEKDAGGLSERVPLYLACRDVLLSRKLIFFFGLPSSDFSAAVYGRYGIDTAYVHAHNFLLTTGMYFGVPTMLFTAAFLVSVFVRCIRVLFINKKPLFRGFWMIPVTLAALVAEDMMESYLCVSAWSMTCISFYLYAGWVTAMDQERKDKVQRRESKV